MSDHYRMTVHVEAPSEHTLAAREQFHETFGCWENVLLDLIGAFEAFEERGFNSNLFLIRRTIRMDGFHAIGRRELHGHGFRVYWYQDYQQTTQFLEFTQGDDGKVRFQSTINERKFDATHELPESTLRAFALAVDYLLAS